MFGILKVALDEDKNQLNAELNESRSKIEEYQSRITSLEHRLSEVDSQLANKTKLGDELNERIVKKMREYICFRIFLILLFATCRLNGNPKTTI